ncbi:hypothetical protein GGI03_001428 [Coemansia sp. RSA 2337]|nr:hypothetical protein GGI03_001428 [Coemansia sp. RSA 2337]
MYHISALALAVVLSAVAAIPQQPQPQCSGNDSICPNNQDGVSSTYLQCNSWSQQYMSVDCPTGQVCFASPTTPGTVSCAPPNTGGVPSAGTCSGHEAKCANPGVSGDYFSCESWSGQFVNSYCPPGLICYNKGTNMTVDCL